MLRRQLAEDEWHLSRPQPSRSAQDQEPLGEGGAEVRITFQEARDYHQEWHIAMPRNRNKNRYMGYRARERKRKRKAAQIREQARSRSTKSASRKWWLTVVTLNTCCARCPKPLRSGMDMVYRATPREALCLGCAERDEAIWRSCKPSLRWEQARKRSAGATQERASKPRLAEVRTRVPA
jgi:hypothetical protein